MGGIHVREDVHLLKLWLSSLLCPIWLQLVLNPHMLESIVLITKYLDVKLPCLLISFERFDHHEDLHLGQPCVASFLWLVIIIKESQCCCDIMLDWIIHRVLEDLNGISEAIQGNFDVTERWIGLLPSFAFAQGRGWGKGRISCFVLVGIRGVGGGDWHSVDLSQRWWWSQLSQRRRWWSYWSHAPMGVCTFGLWWHQQCHVLIMWPAFVIKQLEIWIVPITIRCHW